MSEQLVKVFYYRKAHYINSELDAACEQLLTQYDTILLIEISFRSISYLPAIVMDSFKILILYRSLCFKDNLRNAKAQKK